MNNPRTIICDIVAYEHVESFGSYVAALAKIVRAHHGVCVVLVPHLVGLEMCASRKGEPGWFKDKTAVAGIDNVGGLGLSVPISWTRELPDGQVGLIVIDSNGVDQLDVLVRETIASCSRGMQRIRAAQEENTRALRDKPGDEELHRDKQMLQDQWKDAASVHAELTISLRTRTNER